MASRTYHWKPTNAVKTTTAVQRQMERERVSATMISATPNVPRRGAYQGVIRILAANVNKNISAGPAIARSTPKSNKGRPGCRAGDLFRSFMVTFLQMEHLANFTAAFVGRAQDFDV